MRPILRGPVIFGGVFLAVNCLRPLTSFMLLHEWRWEPRVLILPILAVMLVVFFRYSINSHIRKAWDKSSTLRAEREYQIDETGVRVEGDAFSGFLAWQAIESSECSGGYFFLKLDQKQYHYFPEAIVPDVQMLKDLLAAETVFQNKKS